MIPAIVTSKAAQDHYNDIVAKHADILQGLAVHQTRVATYRAQKASEMQAQNDMKAEMEKERMASDSAARKDMLTFAQKQSEINMKRAQA